MLGLCVFNMFHAYSLHAVFTVALVSADPLHLKELCMSQDPLFLCQTCCGWMPLKNIIKVDPERWTKRKQRHIKYILHLIITIGFNLLQTSLSNCCPFSKPCSAFLFLISSETGSKHFVLCCPARTGLCPVSRGDGHNLELPVWHRPWPVSPDPNQRSGEQSWMPPYLCQVFAGRRDDSRGPGRGVRVTSGSGRNLSGMGWNGSLRNCVPNVLAGFQHVNNQCKQTHPTPVPISTFIRLRW